jgi:hypothetical protein
VLLPPDEIAAEIVENFETALKGSSVWQLVLHRPERDDTGINWEAPMPQTRLEASFMCRDFGG